MLQEAVLEQRPAFVPAGFVRPIGMEPVRKQPEERRPNHALAAAGGGFEKSLSALHQHGRETRQFPVLHRMAGMLRTAAGDGKPAGHSKGRSIDGLGLPHERKVQLQFSSMAIGPHGELIDGR